MSSGPWRCANRDCGATLGHRANRRDLNLTEQATPVTRAKPRGWWLKCAACGRLKWWPGRIHA